MNNAAYELALADPNMLMLPKKELIDAAQKRVREQGYMFVKGKSRSKHTHDQVLEESPVPKRPKINEEMRSKKITELTRRKRSQRQIKLQGEAKGSGNTGYEL